MVRPGEIDPVEVARTALVAMHWDGFDPRPAAALIAGIIGELNAAGHPPHATSRMMRNIADSLDE